VSRSLRRGLGRIGSEFGPPIKDFAKLSDIMRIANLDIRRIPKNRETAVSYPSDFGDEFISLYESVMTYTIAGPERTYALWTAIKYILARRIPGTIVECGVWRGGSMMAAAKTLLACGDRSRELYLFDTFQGMTEPTAEDVDNYGKTAAEMMAEAVLKKRPREKSIFVDVPLSTVQKNMRRTGYPEKKIHYVVGPVESTVPGSAPQEIALLRLDTDWYESTKHELEHLFPRLSQGGVLIIDDYGVFRGSQKATDEFLANSKIPVLLTRLDSAGRMAVKL
jgi:O-methyltransferase